MRGGDPTESPARTRPAVWGNDVRDSLAVSESALRIPTVPVVLLVLLMSLLMLPTNPVQPLSPLWRVDRH